MIIHTLLTTYLFEEVVAEIKDVQARDYSPSVLVRLDRTSYASDINLKQRRKTKIMVKFVWKSWPFSEEIGCLAELYLLELNTTSPTRMPNDKLFQSIKQTINLL